MGTVLSLNRGRTGVHHEVLVGEVCKRQKITSNSFEASERLIPSLPDEISIQILARVPKVHYLGMKLISQNWKSTITSPELYKCRKELGITEEWLYILTKTSDDKFRWYALDPISRIWQKLPPMPISTRDEESRKGLGIGDTIRAWLGRKDLSTSALCGSAVGAVDGCLYVLGGFTKTSSVNSVWQFDPIMNRWSEINPMMTNRAYCKTGVLNNKLYVVGGVSRCRGGLFPLQSAEVFDPNTGMWSNLPNMPFSKAQMPTFLLADMLKPIATGMTSYKGKLYVPQSLYCWPFSVDVGGEVYDPESNSWVEMPAGMGEGWPARQASNKLSVNLDGIMYALDLSSSSLESRSVRIKMYDQESDAWKVVGDDVPVSDYDVSEGDSPYLLAGFIGRLHLIVKDANHGVTVMQTNPKGYENQNSDDVWKVIASRVDDSEELVSCQMLDI
ncbi:F-box/kelch-repeat protein At1g22040 [Impatiens glandulifera]|uniref:F-box/kelch-repeat protein At1g22040 n=1 Tax=Impatiens glandulifera TaxID=253017 RepID=UPI001FB0718B|nr:F-box/kelch-repeat protein At1g22040 [Impatiens glandulifera]